MLAETRDLILSEMAEMLDRLAVLRGMLRGVPAAGGGVIDQTRLDLGCMSAAAKRAAQRLRGEPLGWVNGDAHHTEANRGAG